MRSRRQGACKPNCAALGAEAEFIRADVRNEDDVRALVDQTVARFGRLDVAVNNAGTEGQPGPVDGPDRRKLCRDLRHQRARHAAEHEARAARHAGARQRQHHQHLLDLRARRCGRRLGLCRQQARRRRHHQVRGARGRQSGVRVNAVAPGPTETGMLTRFTGTRGEQGGSGDERSAGSPRRSGGDRPRRSSSSRPTKLHSSPAMSSTSTAARPPAESCPIHASSTGISTEAIMTRRTPTRPRRRSSSRPTASALPIAGLARPTACRSSSTSTTWAPWITGIRR